MYMFIGLRLFLSLYIHIYIYVYFVLSVHFLCPYDEIFGNEKRERKICVSQCSYVSWKQLMLSGSYLQLVVVVVVRREKEPLLVLNGLDTIHKMMLNGLCV